MIINSDKIEEIEVDDLIGEDTSEEVSVDKENMSFFYEMMSKNMYSDPISSIVREVTSNCFDAHKEIGTDAAVIIEGKYEEDNYMLSFIDKGVGISPDRWNKIFKKYLSSTKRDSNNYLGAFGLGSKSPFAYVDSYNIITVYDKIQYHYLMYKKENGIPGAELMLQKPTEAINGTTIKFPLEGGQYKDDWYKFSKAISNQLMYFDNVYVKGFGTDNNYKIFEADTFKYRIGTEEKVMHIVLGKVKYPIKWDLIGQKEIKIPVGIKFDIGQLMVTPNREDLRYTDETKAVLIEGIRKCVEEIKGYLAKGFDTIEEVFAAKKEEQCRQIKVTADISIPFYSGYYGSDEHYNSIKWPFEIPKAALKDFINTPINIPTNPFFLFKVKSKLSKGRLLTADKDSTIDLWAFTHNEKRSPLPLYRTSNFKANKYKNYAIQDAYIVEKKKVDPIKIASVLGLFPMAKRPKIPHRVLGDESPRNIEKLKGVPLIGEWGNKLSLVKLYQKVITKIFIEETQSYDKLEVTLDLVQDYANNLEEKRPKIIKNKESIYASDFNGEDSKVEFTAKQLENTGFIVYGENKQKQQLKVIFNLIQSKYENERRSILWKNKQTNEKGQFYKFLIVNRTDIKRMESLPNSYNIEEFMLKNRIFIEQATKAIVYPIVRDVIINNVVLKLVPRIAELKKAVDKNTMSYNEYSSLTRTTIGQELLEIIKEGKLYNKTIVNEAEVLVKIANDLSIFNKLKIEKELSFDEEKELCAILVKKGYIPDPLYTTVLTEQEIKWMEEWIERGEYSLSLNMANGYYQNNNRLITKTITEKVWKSYPKLLRQNKSDRISLLLLAKTQ